MRKGIFLVGDVGGTKTKLALYRRSDAGPQCLREMTYASMAYATFEAVVDEFLGPERMPVDAACFAVAGPVVEGRCQATNLPWLIDSSLLAERLGSLNVGLLNDLEAMARGLLGLPPAQWVDLNPGGRERAGNRAVLAAGTGFGEAMLIWDGNDYRAVATEGGHADFAPNTVEQDALLVYLRDAFGGHVSYERILSGPGLYNIYRFLRDTGRFPESREVTRLLGDGEDPGAVIGRHAMTCEDKLSQASLRLFIEIYGAEAGNWALKTLAYGGVLIGGGIAPKIVVPMQAGPFLAAFLAKGRFSGHLATVPVRVSLNADAGLLGALDYAARILS